MKKNTKLLSCTFHRDVVALPNVISIVLALVLVVVGIILFVELTNSLESEVVANYDRQITDYVFSYRSPVLTNYFVFITHVGDVYGYVLVLIGLALMSVFVFKSWKYVLQILFVLSLSTVFNIVLKSFINRARPNTEHLVVVETLSFPSGHAMAAIAFYGFLIYLLYGFKINPFLKIGMILLSLLLILSIGLSRIYLGVHFPSDIAGGFMAGFVWMVLCVLIFSWMDVFRSNPKTSDL